MTQRRVAITGRGVTAPGALSPEQLIHNLWNGISSVRLKPEWKELGLLTQVASEVESFDDKFFSRNLRRSMSRISLLAGDATRKALEDARLTESEIRSPRTGLSYGSTMGGSATAERFYRSVAAGPTGEPLLSGTFLQVMSHTAASNLALAFQISGRVIASCVACASSNQAIGFGYESIRWGLADRMICGGAEELHSSIALVFDTMRAATTRNDNPSAACRPFSKDRDGIVVGEGAGTVILEDWDSAVARGATIYGEVVGFDTNTDSHHMTNPSVTGMQAVMRRALESAGLTPDDIGYVNAHGSGTPVGDAAEAQAIAAVFGPKVPMSSSKGHFGHLMGACGVVETIGTLEMMRFGRFAPTLNLIDVDEAAQGACPIMGLPLDRAGVRYAVKNSFAFGGINACLVLKTPS